MNKRLIAALVSVVASVSVYAGFAAPANAQQDRVHSVNVQTKKPAPVLQEFGMRPDGTVVPLNDGAKAAMSKMQSAQSLQQSCTWATNGKCYWYTGQQFIHRSICFQNNLGVYWNYKQAQLGFQSGQNTVLFFNHGQDSGSTQDCADGAWDSSEILTYQAYTTSDNYCSKFTRVVDGLGFYTGPSVLWMNAAPNRPPTCTDTVQHRNNQVSNGIGFMLGLASFSSSTNLTAAVMNSYFANSYNWPGTDDRNALYYLYYSLPF